MNRKLYGYLIVFWLGGITMLCILALAYPQGQPIANAAPPATSDNCEKVATVEGISTYYCESTLGQPWKQNSAGFMLDED